MILMTYLLFSNKVTPTERAELVKKKQNPAKKKRSTCSPGGRHDGCIRFIYVVSTVSCPPIGRCSAPPETLLKEYTGLATANTT